MIKIRKSSERGHTQLDWLDSYHTFSFEQLSLDQANPRRGLALVAGPDTSAPGLTIEQDTEIYAAALDAGTGTTHKLRDGRAAWIQMIRGRVALNGGFVEAGDGAAVEDESQLTIRSDGDSELLLFDLA